ncbi:IQ domain-containing protein H isoform X2 [Xenopus laevis]|uniref:IQ domain-containing protein H isoform X2 n=1 Tax=Xenopus laevis TaxID=8355 RepID=A0A8J0UKK7_XENLA|nr:IQ domain-containing protein H isoform X2 [Xenopus laevis]
MGVTDPIIRNKCSVQDDLEHLKRKLTNTSLGEDGEGVDIQDLEAAIQRTEVGLRKHTEDYLHYISCNPLTLLQDGNKDKYTPHLLKWGHQAGGQNPLDLPNTRGRAWGTISHFSPGQQHKLFLNNRIMCNPESAAHRELLNQSLGISLPLISTRQKTSMSNEKITRGSTVSNLSVLPASNRRDASLAPPPLYEKDMQKGILNLQQRGLIPSAAQLTLVPPAIFPRSLQLHSSRIQKASPTQTADKELPMVVESTHNEETDPETKDSDYQLFQTQLPDDGMDTPYPSRLHSVSSKIARAPLIATMKKPTGTNPSTEDPEALTALALPTGHSFILRNGLINSDDLDFLAFKQRYCLSWGSFVSFLERLQKLLQDYAVPTAIVNGEKLKAVVLDHELGMTPAVSRLLFVLENKSWVQKILNQPGQRYKGREGRTAAAVKIQSLWRSYRDRKAYLTYRQQKWAAGVIAIAWLLHVQRSRVKKLLQESRVQQLQNFRSRAKHLASNWNHIRTCRRSIIHIPSLGYTESQRARTNDLHILQNMQIGRLCDIADPNVDVIYISPVEVDEETQQYYRRLLGLRPAVLSGNQEDACELHDRFIFLTPEAVKDFPSHHMCLSTMLKYSPKTLKRIRNLTRGREAYIVGGVPHVDDLAVADMLDIPLLATEPELAHLYSSKSGSKRIFSSAGLPTAPGINDIYTQQQFLEALAQMIIDNLPVTRWLFKVDNEFGGNGTAFCDIAKYLPCYAWAVNERQRYGPDTWKQKWAQEKALLLVKQELPQVLENHAQPINRKHYPTWDKFWHALVSCGGVIEGSPPAESITCLTVDLLISPDGEIQMVSCGDQIHSHSNLQCVGSTVPQCSVPPDILTDMSTCIGEACKACGLLGYLSVELLTFIDPQSLEQQIWATDLDVCYSDQLAMTQLLLFLTNGTLDCTSSRLSVPLAPKKVERFRPRAQHTETTPSTCRVAVLSSRLMHTNLSLVYYSVFFQMCRAHGIGYDVREKQGTVFVLLENQKRHRLGMLSIADDVQGALMTFARNLFIVHQEISAPNMQGDTNFKDIVKEIEEILGVTEENKLKFDQEGNSNLSLSA